MVRLRWPGRAADAALVLAVGLVAVAGLLVQSRGIDTAAEWAALLAVLVSAGALHLRRHHPVVVGVVALAAIGAYGATEERLRIARELHDVLGHHLSLINVQASAALHRPDPTRSEQALSAIKQTSKETLRELRTTLGILRREGEAPAAPAPGLNRLFELVTTAGRSGLEIRTELAETRPLPPEVDLTAYRIVQEALTNVTRHAGATAAVIRVRPDHDDVLVEVEDDGTGAAGPPGNGILGMGERARALGGSLTTGPRPDGGFRVRARLPLGAGPMPAGAPA